MDRRRRCGDQLGKAAQDPLELAADLAAAHDTGSAGAAGDGIRDQHALARVDPDAGGFMAEPARVRCERRMAVTPHLDVGAAGGGGVHLDDDIAGRLRHMFDPQVLRSVKDRRLHGSTTAFKASPRR
ncbi:MAG TPA: hypothetical protein VMD48_15125 [Solirubrobacteraceae bacterium]|nr:hypothetical protein [Solirubrobacteraceae bacterium]